MEDRIIDMIKSRKDEGLRLFQQEYSGLMHYIVANILNDQEDIDECLSDISMKVWNSIESFSGEKGKFTTWLTVISRNTALNYFKRRQSYHEQLNENSAGSPSPEETVFRQEYARELKGILSTLSTEEKHLLYRKYYYLQQTSQIAAELGMTERSVEGKLYRLRKRLQKRLEVISHD